MDCACLSFVSLYLSALLLLLCEEGVELCGSKHAVLLFLSFLFLGEDVVVLVEVVVDS